MKPFAEEIGQPDPYSFSALGRAVWDETTLLAQNLPHSLNFQCSRSSRMG